MKERRAAVWSSCVAATATIAIAELTFCCGLVILGAAVLGGVFAVALGALLTAIDK